MAGCLGSNDADSPAADHARDGLTEAVHAIGEHRDLHLVGRPEVQLRLSTDTTSTHWVAHLNVDGAQCLGTATLCENGGYQDTRHRDGFDGPKDLEPNVPYNLTLRMYPQYDVVPKGSVLRLVLTNNDAEVSQDNTFARSTVFLGEGQAMLRLPLHDGGILLPEDTLPDPFPGYAATQ